MTEKQKIARINNLKMARIARIGSKHSIETKKIISEKKKGLIPWSKGKKLEYMTGKNHYLWVEDRDKLQRYNNESKDRRSSAYRDWRKNVWSRDKFKCRIDNLDCCGKIEAHHILSWREYPELRYKTNNGITLCHAHHPRIRAEEKRLIPTFQELVTVSEAQN